ncbi:MAG: hypothetical protein KAG61_12010 [Bacteriovoracaceae bacterium]|nr:hypothetical protein [Bacteriovoracaceae bacterium]
MASSLSVGQILHGQSKQGRELAELRKELSQVSRNQVLESEIGRLNQSPYVQDRPYHKIATLKGGQDELNWKTEEVIGDQTSNSLTEHNLKKLDII